MTSKARAQANILSADGTIKTSSFGTGTITSDAIATGAIAAIDMADSSVTSLKIANNSIQNEDLADNAITAAKLRNDVREYQRVFYTASAGDTTFQADSDPGTDNGLLVYLNGIFQTTGVNYTRSGKNVIFSSALDSNDTVDIIRTALVGLTVNPTVGSITPTMFSNELQNVIVDKLTGDGTSTVFGLSDSPYNAAGLLVSVDGVIQSPDVNYSVDSAAITFGSAPDSNADILITHFTYRLGEYSITPSAGTVTEAAFADPFLNNGYLVVKSNTGNPVSPVTGQMYYDDSDGTGYFWDGAQWVAFTNNFSATGGIIQTYIIGDTTYQSHTFTSSGTFTVQGAPGTIDVLLVAGGGGGGGSTAGSGGGGGAGGMVVATEVNFSPGIYAVTVGAGGGGGVGYSDGTSGENSTIAGVTLTTAIGGGGGGASNDVDTARPGVDGGSGGGGGGDDQGGDVAGGSGTSGQGNAGGAGGGHTSGDLGGGGGGAGQVGEDQIIGVKAGDGGDGLQNNYRTGSNVYYAGGGGGGSNNGRGLGGAGGGGDGDVAGDGSNGTANTGGGGGGSRIANGYNGGSGIVVLRYAL